MKNNPKFCITIGVIPNDDLLFEKEIDFVKAALLYADTVNLCSISTSIFFPVIKSSPIEKFKILKEVIINSDPDALEMINDVITLLQRKTHNYSKEEAQLKLAADQFAAKINKEFNTFRINELEPAINKSILHIDLYNKKEDMLTYNLDINKITLDYLCHIDELLKNGNYLILDDVLSSNLTKKQLDTTLPTGKRFKHMEVMRNVMSKLPCFNDLSIKEILDIRSDLTQYLIPFRGAILTYANDMKNTPWSEELQYECEENFIKNIQPAIYEIENQCKHNKNYTDILLKTIGDFNTAELGMLFSSSFLTSLTDYSNLITGAFTGATILTSKLAKRISEKRCIENTIRSNPLFFYYKAGSLIKSKYK
jgi:hypothetical protein